MSDISKRLGDGTGLSGNPPQKQGLMANENAKPNTSTGGTGVGEGGSGVMPPKAGSGNRTTPLRGAKK